MTQTIIDTMGEKGLSSSRCLGGCGRAVMNAIGKCRDCRKLTCRLCGIKYSPNVKSAPTKCCNNCAPKRKLEL